jgi:DNA-binding PadR family transcriptional regulator
MPRQRAGLLGPELPATAWAVLGLLSFRDELSGYDLKKWADNSLRFFYWSPAASQIYAELRRLEARGYARSRVDATEGMRPKRLYQVTPAGRAALRDWVRHGAHEPAVLKHPTLLRVWLGHLGDPITLRKAVEAHRATAVDELDAARFAHEHAPPEWPYPIAVTQWAVRHAQAEIDLADALLGDLDRIARTKSKAATTR